MGFAPASAGTSSSGDWSLGSTSAGGKVGGGGHSNPHRNSALSSLRPQGGGGGGGGGGCSDFGTANANASVTSRSRTVLVPSSSASQTNNVPILRPMTGLARRNTTTATTASRSSSTTATLLKGSRIVESAGYYQSILQSKISDIVPEIERIQHETAMTNGQSKPRIALQTKHDDLMSAVQTLEGNLADYNIAREHLRLGSSPGDIQNSTLRILASNKKKEKEIDGVFYKRKKVEDDIAVVETELNRRHALVEAGGVNGGNTDVVDEYRSLVNRIEAVTVETEQQEDETVVLRHKLQAMMKNDSSDKKNRAEGMKKQLTEVEEDVRLALMKDNEARDHLLRKIDSVQLSTTELEEESLQLEGEITTLQEEHKKLLSEKFQGGTVKACNRLLQKDANLKQYLEEHLPNLKAKLENERSQVEMNIESLRNDIREKERMLEMELPSNEEMELMKDEMAFTEKNLDVNQETMTLLQNQKKKRMDEVCALCLKCCDDNSSILSPHFLDRFFLSWIISIHSMTK